MAGATARLGLIKPTGSEAALVSQLNENSDRIDAAVGYTLVTSTTLPTSPWRGQHIYETDTRLRRVWDGDSWEPTGPAAIATGIRPAATAGDTVIEKVTGKFYIYDSAGNWVPWSPPNKLYQTADSGFPNTDVHPDPTQKVVTRITLPNANYARNMVIQASVYMWYSQTGRIDAFLYRDSQAVDQVRAAVTGAATASGGQSFKLNGMSQVAKNTTPVVELRVARVDGTGTISFTGSSLIRMNVMTYPTDDL